MDGKAPRENLDTGSMDEGEVCTSLVFVCLYFILHLCSPIT